MGIKPKRIDPNGKASRDFLAEIEADPLPQDAEGLAQVILNRLFLHCAHNDRYVMVDADGLSVHDCVTNDAVARVAL